MNHPNLKLFPLLLIALVAACSTAYDFRNENRPSYENTVSASELPSMRAQGATILDVRLIEDFNSDPLLVPDAMYRNPDDIQKWVGQMSPDDGPVVVYCVRGKWVSQKAANYLQDEGFEVYSLEGGIEAWKSANLKTADPD